MGKLLGDVDSLLGGSTMDPRCRRNRRSHQIRANDLIWQESSQSPCQSLAIIGITVAADSAATPQKYADASAKNLLGHQITSLVWEVMPHTRPFETFWFSSFYRNDRPSFNAQNRDMELPKWFKYSMHRKQQKFVQKVWVSKSWIESFGDLEGQENKRNLVASLHKL